MKTESLTSYNGLTVGDSVTVPGHRRRDPVISGVLVAIDRHFHARSTGIMATVHAEGRSVMAPIGLVSKLTPFVRDPESWQAVAAAGRKYA